MSLRCCFLFCLSLLVVPAGSSQNAEPSLRPHTLSYAPGHQITLSLPPTFDIEVAASGLHRVRFFAQAPDGRVFATGLWNLADNTRGSVFLLDGFHARTHRFEHVTTYLDHLRNPNNLAFWTDPATRQTWLYLPLTDRLLRFRYTPGSLHPTGEPETLIRFPDYGLNYKYGGWHLTRTVAIANLHGRTKVYVAVGSSCDYCKEREVARASVIEMEPDGTQQRMEAQGLRNAVDLHFVPELDGGALFATNMGDDHLGTGEPEDTFFELDNRNHEAPYLRQDGTHGSGGAAPNFGWPTCYFAQGKATLDTTPLPNLPPPGDPASAAERPVDAGPSVYGRQPGMHTQGTLLPAVGDASGSDPNSNLGAPPPPLSDCRDVPSAYATFAAHSSPLGLEYFGAQDPLLQNSFLVALHGASRLRIGTGYRVVRFAPGDRHPQTFIEGFLTSQRGQPRVSGRPCGLLRLSKDSFLLSDDRLGLVYWIHPHAPNPLQYTEVHNDR